MTSVKSELSLSNPSKPDLAAVKVSALADTGALMLVIPEHVQFQLGLEHAEIREVTTADGSKHPVPYVGPVRVTFENRQCFVGAMVFGDQVVLGSLPLSELELVVDPADQRLVANPASPTIRV